MKLKKDIWKSVLIVFITATIVFPFILWFENIMLNKTTNKPKYITTKTIAIENQQKVDELQADVKAIQEVLADILLELKNKNKNMNDFE